MKKFNIIGAVLLVLVALSYLAGLWERDRIKSVLVGLSCESDLMREFLDAVTSNELSSSERTRAVFSLTARLPEAGEDLDYDVVEDRPKEDKLAWADSVAAEIRDRCEHKVESGLELRCFVTTMVMFSNPHGKPLRKIMVRESDKKDLFKGICTPKGT